jgi:hypothetical protein
VYCEDINNKSKIVFPTNVLFKDYYLNNNVIFFDNKYLNNVTSKNQYNLSDE